MARRLPEERLNEPVVHFAREDCVRILADQSVGEALGYVQQSGMRGRVVYFYVVDEEGRLQGVVPTRGLLLSPSDTPVKDIMVRDVIALPATATLLDACDLFLFHRLLALPIVDDERRLVGVVDVELYTEELTDLASYSESNDIFQLIGVHVQAVRKASVPVVFRNRFPWLLCNMAGGIACAGIAGWYEGVLNNAIALALFLPVVLALAESVSIQSLTLSLQAQHREAFRWPAVFRNAGREVAVGVLLGLACGGLVAVAAWAWRGLAPVALSILAGIALSIVAATLFGLLVPTFLRAAQRDPGVASGPIVLAMTDVTTLLCYLAVAAWLLG